MEVRCGLRGWSLRWGARGLGELTGLCVPRVLLGEAVLVTRAREKTQCRDSGSLRLSLWGLLFQEYWRRKKIPLPI